MGSTTSHGCWQGACSTFNVWRHKVAKAAGYAVWEVRFHDNSVRDKVMIDWGHITVANLMGEWAVPQADPLIYLIAHANDEGILKPEQAAPLAARLREIVPLLLASEFDALDWKKRTLQFIEGLELAVSKNENITF